MTNKNTSLRDRLLTYVESSQVAFQFIDGLMTFTKLDDGYDSNDTSCASYDEVNEMILCLSGCQELSAVEKKELIQLNLGFSDLLQWSKDSDVLILADNKLLICLPRKDYECLIHQPEINKLKNRKQFYHIGLVDADLLCNGTRHPNLALLKIAGYFRDNGYKRRSIESNDIYEDTNTYELLTNDSNFDDLQKLDHIYVSCVFSFTYDDPPTLLSCLLSDKKLSHKVHIGGTGSYANLSVDDGFAEKRAEDMSKLENDSFLNNLTNKLGHKGIDMRTQMPDYHLYDDYISVMESIKASPAYFKDYKEYSIGFLTRGCFRRCPFCVNKLEHKAMPYSKLSDFLDNEIDEATGKLKRPYIYLWDDNFLASPYWEQLLDDLIATKRPFQFRQGLDERLLAQSKRGEDMAKKLASANYHGDFIFAFDNWSDRRTIVKALKIWKYYCPKRETKFYLFCGFRQTPSDEFSFQKDIAEIFMRICVLMRYGCLGYIMRHEDYKKSPMPNIYVQIARWCNQPGFYRNLSFWQFCYKNQTYWEEHTLGIKHDRLKSYEEFIDDYEHGYYDDKVMTTPLKTVFEFLNKFRHHKNLFLNFFNLSFKKMIEPNLWERDAEITFYGKKYVLNNIFWDSVIGNKDKELALLKAYYCHSDNSILNDTNKSAILLDVLKKYKCSEILDVIRVGFSPYTVEKKDISQFSDFRDAYYSVPFILANCGLKDVDYSRMGYMLRSETRKEVADKKYGENHMKTAAQLGLCNFERCRANGNSLGNQFVKLSDTEQKALLPKLCLYIPYIQNYFMSGSREQSLEEMLNILSETTRVRRRPNVNTIIDTIKNSLDYEF